MPCNVLAPSSLPPLLVLSAAIFIFSIMSAVIDAATGGKIKANNNNKVKCGSWNPNGLFPIYTISGIAYGMVELICRVIPRDIVGTNPEKLRRMDALVHIMYEVSDTGGTFASTQLIAKLGNN
ncbi:uncharacterized protein EI90DRAFT_3028936 [Cantharellus anzutake]|uniref:uncharacterized protein n=1 Tax=Cantharellus anzutake TaxID=1750568 RepID=UPI0019069188|nr:uncharacterized protein EI90DRAFT_3028936 [Cantharellus anzutake]KAF8344241.1 hypothetical protein EI90DRAFT_3028936 [Cantharellus anzutake]